MQTKAAKFCFLIKTENLSSMLHNFHYITLQFLCCVLHLFERLIKKKKKVTTQTPKTSMNFSTNQAAGIITKLPCLAMQETAPTSSLQQPFPVLPAQPPPEERLVGTCRESHRQGPSLQPHHIHTQWKCINFHLSPCCLKTQPSPSLPLSPSFSTCTHEDTKKELQ